MDIYNNKGKFKLLILIAALIIGGASIYYTNLLVKTLAEREERLIDLYAKGLEYAINPENSGSLTFLFQEIIEANNSVPVILTDEHENPISDKNLTIPSNISTKEKNAFYKEEIQEMKAVHEPLIIEYAGFKNYIFYKNSYLLRQLMYYPYVQLTIITIFIIIAYLAFSYSRNAEQNSVWIGLAKETAHQLGTPLSSLIAWLELFKSDPKYQDDEFVKELEKDVNRLEMITARFSNIGSVSILHNEKIIPAVQDTVNYLKNRISGKVKFTIITEIEDNITAQLNKPLFGWVIENVCKNAVDAISGVGKIDLRIHTLNNSTIAIDISDNGKGIHRSKIKTIFKPGFTTKQRGWGLGLTLVKRIVENYHHGKIFVLHSELDQGTTFRIIINR